MRINLFTPRGRGGHYEQFKEVFRAAGQVGGEEQEARTNPSNAFLVLFIIQTCNLCAILEMIGSWFLVHLIIRSGWRWSCVHVHLVTGGYGFNVRFPLFLFVAQRYKDGEKS